VELNTCRSFSAATGKALPIPWTAMAEYHSRMGLDPHDLGYFVALIRSLDADYMRLVNDGKP
jgi:hypothetical protein